LGDFLLWAYNLKIQNFAKFSGYFFKEKKIRINLVKNGLGYDSGDFLKNKSGHPACRCQQQPTGRILRLFVRYIFTQKSTLSLLLLLLFWTAALAERSGL
jgi:hypothetical protein